MSIPQELVPYPNFVCRGLDPPDANGNRPKPPYNARTGIRCDVGDPDNLSDPQTAWNAYQSNSQKYVGIGFAPVGTDIVGVDGDTYKTTNPAHQTLFAEIHKRFGSKTFGEVSPQGGFHYLCRGKLATYPKRDHVEIIGPGRYFTLSPNNPNNGLPIVECQAELEWLWQQLKSKNGKATTQPPLVPKDGKLGDVPTGGGVVGGVVGGGPPAPAAAPPRAATPALDAADLELIRTASEAENGRLFTALYQGRWQELGYPSQSEADLALVNILAHYTDSKEQAERIFHSSALGRDEKAYRPDYLHHPEWGIISKAWDQKLPRIDLRFHNGVPIGAAFARQEPERHQEQPPPKEEPKQQQEQQPPPQPGPSSSTVPPFNPFIFKLASEYTPRSVEWIWKNYLARRKMTILAGMAGTGKSMITDAMVATNSNAGQWPDGSGNASGGYSLVYCTDEDDIEDTTIPRLRACGANMDKVIVLAGRRDSKGNPIAFDPTTDFEYLLQYVRQFKGIDLDLLVLDPVITIVKGNPKEANKVRSALHTINELSRHLNCAVVGNTHFAKNSRDRHILDRVLESGAFVQVARIVLNTVQVKNTPELLMIRSKCSNGIANGGMSYGIETAYVPDPNNINEQIETSRIRWGSEIKGDPNELIAKAEGILDEKQTQKNKGRALLLEMLMDGPKLKSAILIEAEKRGISDTALQRAKQELDVTDEKKEFQGPSWWKLTLHPL